MVGLLTWWYNLWRSKPPQRQRPRGAESTEDYVSAPALAVSAEGAELSVGVVTTRGNVRPHNEDNYYVPGRPSLRNAATTTAFPGLNRGTGPMAAEPAVFPVATVPGLFIVADGMGGQLAGERASQLAVELIPNELSRRLENARTDAEVRLAVRDAVGRANQEILAQSHLHPDYANMGTTVVLALFRNGRAYITGIGDSRAYHVRRGKILQLTRDHSLANALGEAGTIRPEEVETHKFKHVLYLYLGSKDVGAGPEEIRVVEYRPGEHFLLASDGLTGVVRDDLMAELIETAQDPQRAAQLLVNRALENRSKDNVTCIVVKVV